MEALQTAINHWEDALEKLEEQERISEVSPHSTQCSVTSRIKYTTY